MNFEDDPEEEFWKKQDNDSIEDDDRDLPDDLEF